MKYLSCKVLHECYDLPLVLGKLSGTLNMLMERFFLNLLQLEYFQNCGNHSQTEGSARIERGYNFSVPILRKFIYLSFYSLSTCHSILGMAGKGEHIQK